MRASDGCTGLIGRVCVFDPATNTALNLCDGFGVVKKTCGTTTSLGHAPVEVEIRCHPVAAQVSVGKCLRVHVASAAFPRWPRDACTRRGDASTVTVQIVVGSKTWPSGVALPLA